MCIIFSNIGISNESYASTCHPQKLLKNDVTYYYDLDGNGKKEKVKQFTYRAQNRTVVTKLYINGKLKKKYYNIRWINVYVEDFNKYDNRKEIYIHLESTGGTYYPESYIFRYNKNGSFNNYYISGRVDSYENKTGVIRFIYGNSSESSFKYFDKALGGSVALKYNYKKVNKSSFTTVAKSTAYLDGDSKTHDFKAIKKITAYTSTNEKYRSFYIFPSERINIISLYNSNGKKYVKVKSKYNDFGWVKIGSTQLFK